MTVIAHRGASGYLPEHSLPAVAAAHMMNVDFIEQDVVLSKDNIPVVLHDIYLESTTDVQEKFPKRSRKDGRYYAIDFTFRELKQLDLKERTGKSGRTVFKSRYPLQKTGMKIPSLEEEILLIQGMNKSRNKNIGIYVELKKPEFHRSQGQPMNPIVLKTLSSYDYSTKDDKVYIQCFDDSTLKELRSLTSMKLIQLVGENSWQESSADYNKMMTPDGINEVSKYADGIGPYLGYFKGKTYIGALQEARALGLEVHPFTLRKDQLPEGFKSLKELSKHLSQLGATGIFVDHPDLLIKP